MLVLAILIVVGVAAGILLAGLYWLVLKSLEPAFCAMRRRLRTTQTLPKVFIATNIAANQNLMCVPRTQRPAGALQFAVYVAIGVATITAANQHTGGGTTTKLLIGSHGHIS